jgi:virulence factor Mce-like protein
MQRPDPRDRMTDRISRSRLKLELTRSTRPTLVVIIAAVIGLLAAGYAVTQMTPIGVGGGRTAKFALSDATAIRPGIHEVRFKGVKVGVISRVAFVDEQPVATVTIRRDAGPLYRDLRATLRPATALQDMYLDIVDRGTRRAGELRAGETVPASRTDMPVNIDDVLNALRPTVRARLRILLADLGGGIAGRGRALEAVFVQGSPLLRSAGRLSAALRARGPLLRQLVHDSRLLTGELASRDATLRRFVTDTAATLGTVGRRQADLDALLRELPPMLTGANSSLTALRAVVGDVDGAVTALRPVARGLPQALDGVGRLSDAAGPAVRALDPAVRDLAPLVGVLDPTARQLRSSVDTLLPQVPTLNKVTRGADDCEAGIRGFFQWNVSISKFGDRRGAVPRGNVVVGAQSSSILNDPHEYAPQACSGGRPIGGRLPEPKDER